MALLISLRVVSGFVRFCLSVSADALGLNALIHLHCTWSLSLHFEISLHVEGFS